MTRRAGRAVAGLCAALALLTATTLAFAHASLLETEPADGAVLAQAPSQLRLRFNEPVAPLLLERVRPDGSTEKIDGAVSEAGTLSARLPPSAARGTYLLSWRVVSADGHPVGGTLAYSIGAASLAARAEIPEPAPMLRQAIWLVRLALYIALFFGIGGALFRAFMATGAAPASRRTMVALAGGLLALPLAVGLQGVDALAAPWASFATLQTWRTSLSTSYGVTAWLAAASLAAALASAPASRAFAKGAAVAALLLLGAALAASGHASAAPPQWLARPAVFVHVIAVALWVGSLLPLALALRGREGPPILARYSRIIPWVVLGLVASGATLSLLQLDLSRAIWSTDYGRILTAKLALVAVLFGVAAVNRYALTPEVHRGSTAARRRMARLIGLEVLLVLGVLALVAGWRFAPPPRSLSQAAPRSVQVHLHGLKASAELTLIMQPDRRVIASLVVQMPGAAARAPAEVSLELSNPALGIEPLRRPALRQPDGTWRTEPFALPLAGRWRARVELLVSDFEQTHVESDADIAL